MHQGGGGGEGKGEDMCSPPGRIPDFVLDILDFPKIS